MKVTNSSDLKLHLERLGVYECRNVLVHSRLVSFGLIEGGVSAVYAALRQAVGEDGTIAVPTYTLDLSEDTPYDPLTSQSRETGVLSEYVRCMPEAVRSRCPLHNHAAVGPLAQTLLDVAGNVSFGPSSDFEVFHREDFSLLLLGCSFIEGSTFIHHIEAMAGVPYRRWVELSRTLKTGGVQSSFSVRYFARTSSEWDEDFDRIAAGMERDGLLKAVDCPYGRSYLVKLSTLMKYVTGILLADPYALVRLAERDNG